MPEYLSPGVYVEEVDTGSKPIEGVSTSTAGLLGVTERGPVDVPILVTSVGTFDRWFGGKLDRADYANGTDRHCYLPDAIEGFFANGGKRVYVTRVATANAVRATTTLHALNPNPLAVSAATTLLASAGRASGLAAQPLVVLDGANIALPAGANPGDVLRIGDGSAAEYRRTDTGVAAALPNARIVVLTDPIRASVVATTPINTLVPPPAASPTFRARAAALVGTDTLAAKASAPTTPATAPQPLQVIRVGPELYTIIGVTAVGMATTDFDLKIEPRLSTACALNDLVPLFIPPNPPPPATPLALDANAGSSALVITSAAAIPVTSVLLIPNGAGGGDPHAIGTAVRVTLNAPLPIDAALAEVVREVTTGPPTPAIVPASRTSTADARTGDSGIVFDARVQLRAGQLLAIDTGNQTEFRTIRALPSRNSVGNDPGLVVLDLPLGLDHLKPTTAQVVVSTPSTDPSSVLLEPVAAGAMSFAIGGSLNPNDIVEILHSDGTSSIVTVASTAPIAPALIAVASPLARAHRAGEAVVERVPLLEVSAIDSGIWGNRLRIAVQHEGVGLVAPTNFREKVDQTNIRLASSVGVEAGTVLELLDADGVPVPPLLKVVSIDRQQNDKITLADPLSPAHDAVIIPSLLPNSPPVSVRSREFRLTVELLHQRDPARPLRNEMVIASEVFPNLSMDPRHSRYVQNVIGDSDPTAPKRLFDRRSNGESRFIRVHDVESAVPPSPASLVARVGPEALVDILPTGVRRPARLALGRGDDLITTIDDDTYIGLDNVVPELRTGLQSFRNIDAISIVGCPGRTSVKMQSALISHCEELRYRFAVLDCAGPPNDTISDVQSQRQNHDSKYAALYYPWMMVPEVFPTNLAVVNEEAIPPSGHVLGLYARIDVDRGVHKAPANEVVRGGIVNLRRTLNKGEHDILNPFPTNINVIRDFRPDNRAIRVYGGRVITSDPDWKYVNVRRLLIFIEKSIDIGLQWVVFEPNAEPLWARVNRSVSNFLTTVWRNGALEGVTKAEAFFVKCDRTTMTQADIDNGRLIVEVGVAPVKPAEFVVVRIGLFTAHADN